ncbi:E3 ubiquitin-protein ligase TRIM11-like isoform X2 [Phaenicophaeus curvirostris]|uniref:E3 ubiquitin-protein ligase TRIM11-like isoform X2 n=1 Tax=Phaenicophaeus curvirostris TaxID=33595 RepID=UPI0037F0B485
MAAAKELQEEAICSICLDFFCAPVMLDCGHNFCQACISSYWAGAAARACPQCRDSLPGGVLRPNRPLGNIAEGLRRLGPAWGDEEPVQSELERLRREKGELEKQERKERWMCEDRLEKVKVERRKIVLEFKQLRQYLEEQECLLSSRLGELEEQIATRLKENAAKFSKQLIYLGGLIKEKERQLPGHQSLQDAGDVLSRCEREKSQPKEEMNYELKKEPGSCSENTPALEEMTRTHQVNITLDPDTAQPWLIISEDHRSVMQGATKQSQLNRPERFNPWTCVLGCEGFDSGRQCWEVEVAYGSCWAMGVALESVTRQGPNDMSPEGGIWAVGRYKEKFLALTSPSPTPVLQSTVPRRVRICLDHAGGQVMFVDVDSEATIFTFPQAMFGRERIHPWFWVGHETQLKMCL